MIFGDHDTQQPALIKVDAWHNPRSGLLKGVVIFGGYDVAYVAGVLHLLGMALRDYSISCGPSRCHRACRLQGGRGGGLRNRNPRLLSFGTVHFFFFVKPDVKPCWCCSDMCLGQGVNGLRCGF